MSPISWRDGFLQHEELLSNSRSKLSTCTITQLTPIAQQPIKTLFTLDTSVKALFLDILQVAANPNLAVAIQNIGPGSIHLSQRKARLALRASTPQPLPQQRQPLASLPSLRPTHAYRQGNDSRRNQEYGVFAEVVANRC